MKALLACWLTAIAVLVWLATRPTTFEQRWPTALPPAMSVEMFNAARKASERPAFCRHYFETCRIG